MMNGPEKSDSVVVAMNLRTRSDNRLRSGRSQGPGPRGTRDARIRDGLSAEKACHSGWTVYGQQRGHCHASPSTPEGGAVYPNWARTDLCRGRPAMGVPTANTACHGWSLERRVDRPGIARVRSHQHPPPQADSTSTS